MNATPFSKSLRQLELFSGISEAEMKAVTASARARNGTAGSYLFRQGDSVTQFYIILSGTFQLLRSTPDGDEKTIDLAQPGQLLGAAEILDHCKSYRASALALGAAELAVFDAEWLVRNACHYPAFALNLLSAIAHRMHMAELEAEHQAMMSATQLVACFLQRLCVVHHADPSGFALPYPKSVIASRLGMAPETFSRTLKQLKTMGIVVEGNKVSISRSLDAYVCTACSVMEQCQTRNTMQVKLRHPKGA